ncbi:TolC family protein [Caminibacter pacificus]|jgi:outer membrane protein TolC
MKKLSLVLIAASLYAADIGTLFDAIKKQPETKIDNLQVKNAKIAKKSVINSLYPTVNLFSSAEHYNSPFSLRPVTPTQSAYLLKTNASIPFSQNIIRVGFDVSMPLFIKTIYDNKEKMSHIINAAKYKAKLNLLQRESMLVIYLSNLNYLYSLKKALLVQKNSIQESIKAIEVGVKVGRIPEFKLLRLKDAVNQIDIKINDIDSKIADTNSKIYTLTKIHLKKPINFQTSSVKKEEFLAVKPIKENIKASLLDIKAKKDDFLPKVFFKISANRGFGWAYNTKDSVALNTASAGIYINWNIFNKKRNSEVQKAKIEYMNSKLTLQKTIKELTSQIEKIDKTLKIVNRSLSLAKKSVKIKEELLKSAKVAFKLGTMTVDEYLNYENDLALAKANVANLKATKNSLIAQKAFIYGNNFKKVFK